MQRRNKTVKLIALILAILMVLGLFTMIMPNLLGAGADQWVDIGDLTRQINVAQGDLRDLDEQSQAIDEQLESLRLTLFDLRSQRDVYEEELFVLQDHLELLRQKIELTEEQIYIYRRLLDDKEVRLDRAVIREEEQRVRYRARVRAMEESGTLSYWQIILTARNFSDLIMRMRDVEDIMEHDQRMADDLERFREDVHAYMIELENDRVQLGIRINRLEGEREELQEETDALQIIFDMLVAKIAENEEEERQLYQAKEQISDQVLALTQQISDLDAEIQAELERRRLERGTDTIFGGEPARPGTGVFLWPSDVTFGISSPFGPRWNTMHWGIDIPAPMGTNVLAADCGVVVDSRWNGGFGYYILINHGNGYFTLYAHQMQNLVSAGQMVSRGEVIGLVGSTGFSTGPHIHFEIHRHGERVDPMIYFPPI